MTSTASGGLSLTVLPSGILQYGISLAPLQTVRFPFSSTRHRYYGSSEPNTNFSPPALLPTHLPHLHLSLPSLLPPAPLLPSSLPLPLQQWRLLPNLAAVYVLTYIGNRLFEEFVFFTGAMLMGDKTQRQVRSEGRRP